MDTNRIKRFATEARNILKAGIAAKILTLGFDKKGDVAEENKPQLMQGGSVWNGQLHTEGFYHQWMALYGRIQQIGIKDVYEEAAYTWFNRLCAIRILQKNHLCQPVLAYADAARTPIIVDEARQGHLPPMQEEARLRLMELLDDDTKVTDQFAVLITAWCHANPIINSCFGGIADYTELLLPNNILAEGGFVDLLNHTEFISDDDFHSPELIGWLYQFYISERKDEVFAKKGKFEADEIPAATQIFTPNWIVKYMVQNTVGRIYLDNNPYETQLQKKWQYLVGDVSHVANANLAMCGETPHPLHYDELTDLKVADLACGSGHILNECFDLLYDLYIAEGYSRTEAIENIFLHNLTGIDLDTRAKQLATFALLLKACQKEPSFAEAGCLPNVLCMPKAWDEEKYGNIEDFLAYFFHGQLTKQGVEEIKEAFELIKDAETLGSIMKFDLSDTTRLAIKEALDFWSCETLRREPTTQYIPAFKLMYALTEKYHALVMNPPYMGGGKMNNVLSKYVKDNYAESKADLFSVFMDMGMDRLAYGGKMAQINMQSWMFLSSFERLRDIFLHNYIIDSMLHLGPRTFDELSGEVVQNTAFVLTKPQDANELLENIKGTYYRLVDGKNCADKEQLFLSHKTGNEDGNRVYYPNVAQKNFEKIPGCPIGYWVREKEIQQFAHGEISSYAKPCKGIDTGENAYFLRLWHEVSFDEVDDKYGNGKWVPYNKGGGFRRWYGFRDYLLRWNGSEDELASRLSWDSKKPTLRNRNYWFKEAFTWSSISSDGFSARYSPKGALFDNGGSSIFSKDNLFTIGGLINSKVADRYFEFLSPTLNFQPGDVGHIAYSEKLNNCDDQELVSSLVQQNIFLSKYDWDSHETSWDFQRNELLSLVGDVSHVASSAIPPAYNSNPAMCDETPHPLQPPHPLNISLEDLVNKYKQKWESNFMQLHANEEELNRQFIQIYGLEDELSPDVPLDEITILQQGEITIES